MAHYIILFQYLPITTIYMWESRLSTPYVEHRTCGSYARHLIPDDLFFSPTSYRRLRGGVVVRAPLLLLF